MKAYISKHDMIERLMTDEYANWSYFGASALVDYLENLEAELELDMRLRS